MPHARLYIRRSDDDQSSYSPEAQERAGRAYCESRGYTLIATYVDDDLSGKLEHRDNLQRLLRDAKADRGSIVIVHKFDRLARDTELLLRTVYKVLLPASVHVESVMEAIDPYTPLGKAMLTVSGSFSTYYVDNLAQEVKKGLREKWERGGANGPVALGYTRVFQRDARGERIRGTDILEPNKDAEIVRLIFECYATGNYSPLALAQKLNAEGHTTENRGRRVPFTGDTIRTILENPIYIGLVRYKGETRPGAHPPIVDINLWTEVITLRTRRAAGHVGKPAIRTAGALLTEIGYCGGCGAKLHNHLTAHGRYYRCKTRRQFGRDACGERMVFVEDATRWVCELLAALTFPESIAHDALAMAQRMAANPPPTAAGIDRARIQEQLRRLKTAYLAGDPDVTDTIYAAERARLEAQLVAVSPAERREFDYERAMQVLNGAAELYDTSTGPEQRALVHGIFGGIWLSRSGIVAIQPKPAYALLVEARAGFNFLENPTPIGLGSTFSIPPRWVAFNTPGIVS